MYTVLESILPVTDEEFKGNLERNLERNIPRCQPLPERKDKLALVGSGPSVREYLDEICDFPGEVWAINGAYDFLRDGGIIADGFVGCDPLPGLDDYLCHPVRQTTFYLAGTCDPSTFDAVAGYDVRMWFLKSSNLKYPKGLWTVTGGTTCLLRAPFLGYMLGYRDVTIYGADSSFDTADRRYAYRDGTYKWDSVAPVNWVMTRSGEGPFPTEICLIKQVSQFHAISQLFNQRAKMTFRCGGLMRAFLNAPIEDGEMFEKAWAAHDNAA